MITRIEELNELSSPNIAFWIYSKTGKSFQYISPKVKDIFETNIEKITDIRDFRKLVHPEDQTRVIRNLNGGFSGSLDELDYRIVTSRGKIKWLKNTAVTIEGEDTQGQVIIGCTYILPRRKKSHKQIYPVNLENVLKSLPDSHLIIDTKGKVLHGLINKNEKLLKKDIGPSIGKNLGSILNSTLAKKIKTELSSGNFNKGAISFEFRVYETNKSNWFEIRILKLNNEVLLIYMRNISELWNNVNSVEKFYNITEQSHELVMMTDVTGIIEYVNPKLCTVSGYEVNELIGKNASIFKTSRQPDDFYVNLWRTILEGKTFKAEFQNSKKNGDYFLEEKIITPLFHNGHITNFISTGRDITLDRKNELKANKHRQLEVTIAEKEHKSRTLSLIKSNENERKIFAREIHEGVSQMLSVAMINLENLTDRKVISVEEKDKLELVNKMVSEIIQELRGISKDLSPSGLYKFGLFPVIKQMVEKNNLTPGNYSIKFLSNIEGLRFKNEIEINIYRIIEEALKNALKHSKATKVNLNIFYDNGNLLLSIKDNGEGINMNTLEFKKINTFGILNIEARAKSIGAGLIVNSRKNKGFALRLELQTKTLHT